MVEMVAWSAPRASFEGEVGRGGESRAPTSVNATAPPTMPTPSNQRGSSRRSCVMLQLRATGGRLPPS
jgi:hypothetical protein